MPDVTAGGIQVAVQESPRADVGLGRARIDTATRTALKVNPGDVLLLIGKKSTAAVAFRLGKQDERKGIVRIDGLIRSNVGASIGDRIEIRKAVMVSAESVTLAPVLPEGHMIGFGDGIQNFVKRGLLNRPLTKGDVVIVPGIVLMEGALPFKVLATTPDSIVRINRGTKVILQEKPVLGESTFPEEPLPPETLPEFARDLRNLLMEYWQRLDRVEGEAGLRARKLRDEIYRLLKDAGFETEDDAPGTR